MGTIILESVATNPKYFPLGLGSAPERPLMLAAFPQTQHADRSRRLPRPDARVARLAFGVAPLGRVYHLLCALASVLQQRLNIR